MWLTTQWKLRRALCRYRRDGDVDAVLGAGAAEVGSSGLEVGRAVGHGHAGAYGPEHLQIVVAVAKGHGIGFRDAIGLQHDGDAVALASGSGNDVHGAVPPGGDLGSVHILQDAAVLVLPAAHHDLVHGAGGNGVKVGRYRHGDLVHGKIIVQILLVAVGGKGALGGHAQGAEQFSARYGKSVQGFDREAAAMLRQYGWPGNIRELKNTVRRAVVFAGEGRISAQELNLDQGMKLVNMIVCPEKEEQQILRILGQTGNNRTLTARILGISRTALYYKLRKYGIV